MNTDKEIDRHMWEIYLGILEDEFLRACIEGDINKVKEIMTGGDIPLSCLGLDVGFNYACKHNHEDIAKFIIENGGEISEIYNSSSLELARRKGYESIVKMFPGE